MLPTADDLLPLLDDLGHRPSDAQASPDGRRRVLLEAANEGSGKLLERVKAELAPDGLVLVWSEAEPSEHQLAALRNQLWPTLHAIAIYRVGGGRARRVSLSGSADIDGLPDVQATVSAFRRRDHVLSPAATREKFDQNASGWNGEPGGPGYPHFRWMRRLMGRFAGDVPATRILDFGCGAGWCGIEAAKRRPGAHLAAFDPSPEMVKHAESNARAEGLADFEGRTGFGEAPPFPRGDEAPFDLVISSGVVSFSPDFEGWMEGLVGTVAPGGTLVVGDLDPRSRGMRKRRESKPLLPVREMNGRQPGDVAAWLESRGYRIDARKGYQLSWPMPQAMYVNETKLKGLLSFPLVWINAGAAGLSGALGGRSGSSFDSWALRCTAPA